MKEIGEEREGSRDKTRKGKKKLGKIGEEKKERRDEKGKTREGVGI